MRLLTFQKAQMDTNQTNGRDKWQLQFNTYYGYDPTTTVYGWLNRSWQHLRLPELSKISQLPRLIICIFLALGQ